MKKKITIAIDGFSSTGKSTLAKLLANKYNYIYVDTGAMYRAVALYALENNFISKQSFDKEKIISSIKNIELTFEYNVNLGFSEIFINGNNVEKKIRTLKVSKYVSKVATIPEVRRKLVYDQKQMIKENGIVMDGRDIGTVVFPDAELKLFMTATAEIRAKRRYKELIDRGESISYDEVLQNVIERDRIDSTREDSPLAKAKDAVEFDNSNMTVKEQFNSICKLIDEKL